MNPYYPIRGYGDVSNMIRDYVMERARQCLARAAAEKASVKTAEQARARQARLSKAFFAAIGGLPPRSGDLSPKWGPLRERGAYSVQNVMFLAAPDVYGTATVWRPVGWSGKRPAVLFACGHTESPREAADYQHTCVWFTVNGYVTLAFDPPGQGEQKLCWDPVLHASFAGHGSSEHQHCGLQCELVGHNIARYFVQHGIAAFDLLASLPEVDATRVAVNGYSGGGTQSSYLMIAEPRLAAAMPCLFTTAREVYMRRPHWHDEEQNITGSLLAGLDYDDFYFCFAPRPAAIGAATMDFFPIEGTRLAYERAKHVYGLFGAEDRIALFEAPSIHNFHPVLSRGAVEFFNRFLQPGAEVREPSGFQPEPPESQRNTPTGQVRTSIPVAKLVFEQNLDAVAQSRSQRHAPTPAELAAFLRLPDSPAPLNPRVVETRKEDDLEIEKCFIFSEPDILVPLLRLAGPRPQAALLYACDGGTQSIDGDTEKLLRRIARQGVAVYLAEPRGTGETFPSGRVGDPPGTSWLGDVWIPQHVRMLGTSVAALRAYDLARALEYVRIRDKGLPVKIMARGMMGWCAVMAAALDGSVEALCLHELRPSIEEFATEPTARVPQPYAMPGILNLADIPLLIQAAKPTRVLLLEPVDSLGRPIGPARWQERHAPAWRGTTQNLRVECHVDSRQRHAAIADIALPQR